AARLQHILRSLACVVRDRDLHPHAPRRVAWLPRGGLRRWLTIPRTSLRMYIRANLLAGGRFKSDPKAAAPTCGSQSGPCAGLALMPLGFWPHAVSGRPLLWGPVGTAATSVG